MKDTNSGVKRLTKIGLKYFNEIKGRMIKEETFKGGAFEDLVSIPNDGKIIEIALEKYLNELRKNKTGEKKNAQLH